MGRFTGARSAQGTSGHVDDLAGHESGALAGQERDRVRDVLGRAPTRRTGICVAAAFLKSSNAMPTRAAVAAVMSVAMNPGATALAVMPNWPSSIASVLVKPCRPALAAE